MNKYLFSITGLLVFTANKAYCAVELAGPELEKSLKQSSSEPNIFSIVFALLFVIALIYVTGIIYSKLNLVGSKTVQDQIKKAELNRAVVLSTTQLGQDKNLHVIELNGHRYLIGVAASSINLIKEIEFVKEATKEPKKVDEEESKKQDEVEIDKALKFLYGGAKESMIEPAKEEFDIHKKYL